MPREELSEEGWKELGRATFQKSESGLMVVRFLKGCVEGHVWVKNRMWWEGWMTRWGGWRKCVSEEDSCLVT